MKITHRFKTKARCPVDRTTDVYEVTLVIHQGESAKVVKVEDILYFSKRLGTVYQEDLTRKIAEKFSAQVTTVGTHSGVETTVEC